MTHWRDQRAYERNYDEIQRRKTQINWWVLGGLLVALVVVAAFWLAIGAIIVTVFG